MDDKPSMKGVWLCSHNPFLHAQLWTYKNVAMACPLTEISNTVDDGPVFVAVWASSLVLGGSRAACHRQWTMSSTICHGHLTISTTAAFLLPDAECGKLYLKNSDRTKASDSLAQTEIAPVSLGCLTTAHCDRLFACIL